MSSLWVLIPLVDEMHSPMSGFVSSLSCGLSSRSSRRVSSIRKPEEVAADSMHVSFCTDVEGNWEYFVSFIECSEALSFVAGPSFDHRGVCQLNLAEGWRFVFGGDVCDKGGVVGGTVRVTRTLLALKQTHPSRVTLLLGNRDLNKMRLTSELAPSQLEQLDNVAGPYWVPPGKRVRLRTFLARRVAAEGGIDEASVAEDEPKLVAANTAANRLRYLLKETMGAEVHCRHALPPCTARYLAM